MNEDNRIILYENIPLIDVVKGLQNYLEFSLDDIVCDYCLRLRGLLEMIRNQEPTQINTICANGFYQAAYHTLYSLANSTDPITRERINYSLNEEDFFKILQVIPEIIRRTLPQYPSFISDVETIHEEKYKKYNSITDIMDSF